MKNIKWGKLVECAILGILLSICIIAFSVIIVVFIKLICLTLKLYTLIIVFILLAVGLTYWVYKNDVI